MLEELLGYATKRLNFCKTTSTKLLCVHRVLVGLEIYVWAFVAVGKLAKP